MTAVGLLWALCAFATGVSAQQQPEAVAPAAEAAPGPSIAADSVEEVDRYVEIYFREKAGRGRPGVAVKRLHRTPSAGVFVGEMENGWLTRAFRVRSSDDTAEPTEAPLVGAEAVEAEVEAFVKLEPAPIGRIHATLQTLGLTLDKVYRPATGPYFNNGRGLVFDRKGKRFVLVARGVRDEAANRCFKAAIDIKSGEILSNADVPCRVE